MARVQVRLDPAGIRQILQSAPMRAMVVEAGDRLATAVRAQGRLARSGAQSSGPDITGAVRVVVGTSGYDGRPVAQVSIAHPAGVAMQARHGVMTRAIRALPGADWNPRR